MIASEKLGHLLILEFIKHCCISSSTSEVLLCVGIMMVITIIIHFYCATSNGIKVSIDGTPNPFADNQVIP